MGYVAVIGGINIDIEGRPFAGLQRQDSNPGRIHVSHGGVGRNIAENIARLGGQVAILSAVGGDGLGDMAVEKLRAQGVDVSHVIRDEDASSSMYLSLLDDKGDMELAMSDMDVMDALTKEVLLRERDFLRGADMVVLDGNLKEDIIGYAAELLEGVKIFYDPVSTRKAARAKSVLGTFHSIKPNIMEAEVLAGMKIESDGDIRRAARNFLERGVRQVFITLNRRGVYFASEDEEGFLGSIPKEKEEVASATGAGDSFSASVVVGTLQNKSMREIAEMGTAAASITMESREAVSKNMSLDEVLRRMRENV